MKVLWFTNTPCSGAERGGQAALSGGWLVALQEALREYRDVELEIACFSSGRSAEDEFVHEGVRYHVIQPYRSSSWLGFRLKRLFMSQAREDSLVGKRMMEVFHASRPDIVHIQGTERPFGQIAEIIGGRTPVVCSIQGLMSVCVEKFFSGVSRHDVSRYEDIGCKLMKKSVERDYGRFCHQAVNERRFLGKQKYVIGRTQWDKRITGLFNPDRKYFHIDEIMRAPFYSSRWAKDGFGTPLKIVSTLSYGVYKGFETLLKTAALLKENATFPFEWLVIGLTGNESHVRISERMSGLSSSGSCVRFLGRKNADEMVEILCGADIFCHVSHVDNSPNSVCEAMLLGMPVIATTAGGTADLLDDGKEGMLVHDGDPYVTAGAVVCMQQDFAGSKAMGAKARERAQARHDKESVCRKTMDMYRSVLEEFAGDGLPADDDAR